MEKSPLTVRAFEASLLCNLGSRWVHERFECIFRVIVIGCGNIEINNFLRKILSELKCDSSS